MDWEEAAKPPKREIVIGEDLATLSVAELETRIATLEAEIERLRGEIKAKRAHTSAADALFRKG